MKRAVVGREPSSGLYYEILGAPTAYRFPLLFIHGGGGSGDGFRATLDGRIGWADMLAERGYRCWVTDWPGTGRSGYRNILTLRYEDVVEGYLALLRDVIREPVVVLPHSMGGPTTWKLIEREPKLVAGVVGIAAGYPGNLAARNTKIVSDDGRIVKFAFGDTGVAFEVDRSVPYIYEDAYIFKQGIAGSRHFPRELVPQLRVGLSGFSPIMLLQRAGAMPGMPVIKDFAGFAGKPIRLVAGDEDPAHTLEIEKKTADLLRSWGADVQVTWLPDRGISGNGHFLQFERNYEEVLDVIVELFRSFVG